MIRYLAAVTTVVLALPAWLNASPNRNKEQTLTQALPHDFAFLYGRWHVKNRKLAKPLSGSQEWNTFDSTSACIPILDGLGNVDEFRTQTGPLGTTMRYFDLASRRWSLWWVSSRDGLMQLPVTGAFQNGVGTFVGPDTYAGKAIQVRYIWHTTPDRPRWEQAFSEDNGRTWEVNWVMEFERDSSASPAPWPPQLSTIGERAR